MSLHDPWPERRPGRPKRTTPYVEVTMRFDASQLVGARGLVGKPGWPGTIAGVLRVIIERELAGYDPLSDGASMRHSETVDAVPGGRSPTEGMRS